MNHNLRSSILEARRGTGERELRRRHVVEDADGKEGGGRQKRDDLSIEGEACIDQTTQREDSMFL